MVALAEYRQKDAQWMLKNKIPVYLLFGVVFLTVIDVILLFMHMGAIIIFASILLGIVSLVYGVKNKHFGAIVLGVFEIIYPLLYFYVVSGFLFLLTGVA